MTKVDLVVVTFNSAQDIEGFLDALDALGDADLRVFVADNASADDTVARALGHRRAPRVIETGGNNGYAAAINAVLPLLDDDALFIIANPDIRLIPGFLAPVLAAAEERDVGIVTPRLVDDQGVRLPSLRRDPKVRLALAEAVLGGHRAARLRLSELITDAGVYRRAGDVEWASGALLAVTPRCRRLVGSWDESFFLYSEETDYQLRARRAGLRVRYTPDAEATHRGGAAHVDPRLWSIMTSNRVRLFRKYHGGLHTTAFGLAVLLNELLRFPMSATHRRAGLDLVRRFPSVVAG